MADSEPASIPAAPPPSQTLGQMLRAARLAQDLTLEQLSTELRIEARQLGALEADRFEQIGVPVFVKGYLKQYGTRLGVNVADLLALYYKQTTLADVQVQPSKTIKLRDERQITSWVVAAVLLLVVVAGLAVWWLNGGNFGALPLPLSTQEPAATSAPAPAEPVAQPALQRVEQPPAPTPTPPPAESPAAAAPVAGAVVDAAAGVVAAPSVSNAAAAREAAPVATEAAADEERAVSLEFSFEQESWAEVTDARGERLLFGLNAAGRTVSVRGEAPFAVVLGNANAVRLTVDGEPYELPLTGRQGDLARFSVNVAGD